MHPRIVHVQTFSLDVKSYAKAYVYVSSESQDYESYICGSQYYSEAAEFYFAESKVTTNLH